MVINYIFFTFIVQPKHMINYKKTVLQIRVLTFILCLFILSGCETNYYLFDGSPDFKKDRKAIELLSEKGVGGTYIFKEMNSDTIFRGESFKSWDFEQYRSPVLKTEDDTIRYIMAAFIHDRLFEIYKDGKELKYHFSCYVNAPVFDNYILRQQKRIPYGDSTSLSAQIISDTLHIYKHSIKKDSAPTVLEGKYKYRKVGSVYQTDSWFGIRDLNYDYLSVVDTAIYSVSVIKDSVDKANPDKPHYIIGKISATKESITYRELPYYSDSAEQHIRDSIIGSIGQKVKDRIIAYNEAGLTKIFESPIAVIEFELQKILNFPSDRNKNSENSKTIFYVGGGILLILGIFLLRRKKRT